MEKLKSLLTSLKLKLDLVFFHLVSASWFPQLPNKKVIKIEIFYAWMSIAGFLGAYGLARDVVNQVEFSTQYYLFLSMFLLGWILKAGTIFGYKVSRKAQDHFWETQLMRFLDPAYFRQFDAYPNSSEKLKRLKYLWLEKHGVTVEWTRANSPFWHKIQIVLLIGCIAAGLGLGLIL